MQASVLASIFLWSMPSSSSLCQMLVESAETLAVVLDDRMCPSILAES